MNKAASLICPMCLTEFPAGKCVGCPGCKADDKPVALMPTMTYLSGVDFAVVEEFWRAAPPSRDEVRKRVMDRVARLKERQRAEFGTTLPQLAAGLRADPRVTILN